MSVLFVCWWVMDISVFACAYQCACACVRVCARFCFAWQYLSLAVYGKFLHPRPCTYTCRGGCRNCLRGGGVELIRSTRKRRGSGFGPNVKKPTSWAKGGRVQTPGPGPGPGPLDPLLTCVWLCACLYKCLLLT